MMGERIIQHAAIFGLIVMLVVSTGGWPMRTQAADAPVTILYKVRSANDGGLPAIKQALGSTRSLGRRAPRHVLATNLGRVPDMRQWRSVRVPSSQSAEVWQTLQNNPTVEEVRYALEYEAAVVPNDPELGQQYGLVSSPQADIQAPAAWDVTQGSADTVIAVVDGGVDSTHPDLVNKLWTNSGEIAGNNLDDDHNGYVDDVNGWDFVSDRPPGAAIDHATHIAGVLGADSNNGVGIAGIDWHARIMSVRVLGNSGVGSEDNIVAGLMYAVENGADIISISIVGGASPALLAAVQNAYAANVVVVAAAGNSGRDTALFRTYPACGDQGGVDMVVGVGATDEAGEPTHFSNYGPCVNISAPGNKIFSTKVGNKYGLMTGTSMSTPFVAGVAGLYKAVHPNATAAEIIAAVSSGDSFTGEDAGEWNADYKGKLNAAKVVGALAVSNPDPETTPTPTPVPVIEQPETSHDGGGEEHHDGGGGGGGGSSESVSIFKPQLKPRVAGARITHAQQLLLPRIKGTFNFVFGRVPTPLEKKYWAERVTIGNKPTYTALLGAMRFQQSKGRTYDPKLVVVKAPTTKAVK